MVTTQAARILFNRRRGGVNAVNEPEDSLQNEDHANAEEEEPICVNSMEDLIGAFNRLQGRAGGKGGGKGAPRRPGAQPRTTGRRSSGATDQTRLWGDNEKKQRGKECS